MDQALNHAWDHATAPAAVHAVRPIRICSIRICCALFTGLKLTITKEGPQATVSRFSEEYKADMEFKLKEFRMKMEALEQEEVVQVRVAFTQHIVAHSPPPPPAPRLSHMLARSPPYAPL